MHHSNIVFGCSKWQRLTYSEYLIAWNRSKSNFYMNDMYLKIFTIGLLICIYIYRFNREEKEIKNFLIPVWYFFLLIPSELQNLVLFIFKLLVFPLFVWIVLIRWYLNQKREEEQVNNLKHKDLSPRDLKIKIA